MGQPHDCLLNHLFRRRSQKTTKLRVTGLFVGNSPGTNVSIWWRHHVLLNARRSYTLIRNGPSDNESYLSFSSKYIQRRLKIEQRSNEGRHWTLREVDEDICICLKKTFDIFIPIELINFTCGTVNFSHTSIPKTVLFNEDFHDKVILSIAALLRYPQMQINNDMHNIIFSISLQWRHNKRDGFSNNQLFTQTFVQAKMKDNIKAPRH